MVLITSIPGVGLQEQRAKGFKEEIAAKYPGLNLVADTVADGQATTALNIMTGLITANPNLRGVFASNLIVAQGAGQAIADNKVADKIKLVGFDSDDKLVKLVKLAGSDVHTTRSHPYTMKREKRGDTASGVVIARENEIISIDINPCSGQKAIVTFVTPYKEKQISDANCGKGNTYPQSQVIQQ